MVTWHEFVSDFLFIVKPSYEHNIDLLDFTSVE